MKKAILGFLFLVSLAACTKEELKPKAVLYQPYGEGYVVAVDDTHFTVAKILDSYYDYFTVETLLQEDGWYIPSYDELYSVDMTKLPQSFTYQTVNGSLFWTTTFDPTNSYYFMRCIVWSNGIVSQASLPQTYTTNVILFKKFVH